MILGLLYVFSSLSAARKMKELRIKSFSKREISAKFKKYDEDDNGQLDFDEFHKLLIDLNIDINRNEAETLFLRADRDVLYGIDFEEFTRFWEECDKF
jgi:Ca2+-binding EF-hand superfamily protein